MKKLLIIGATLLTFVAFAQEGPQISSAVIAIDQRADLADAKQYIEKARRIIDEKGEGNVKNKILAKYYHYYGKIHLYILQSDSEEIQALDDDALDKAIEYLFKSYDFEKRINKNYFIDLTIKMIRPLPQVKVQKAIIAVNQAQNQELQEEIEAAKASRKKAYENFMAAFEMSKKEPIGKMDTSSYFSAANQLFMLKDYEKAIEYYKNMIDWGYKGVSIRAYNIEKERFEVFPNLRSAEISVEKETHKDLGYTDEITPDLYQTLASLYRVTKKMDEYREILKVARELYPDNERLLREELQVFLDAGEFEKVLENIEQSLENDPNNALFHFIKGTIYYKNIKDTEKAREAYKATLAIEPDHADASFNFGITYVHEANAYVDRMNKLTTSPADMKKFDKLKAEQKKLFEKALPYFEKANEVKPNDPEILNALRESYFKTGNQKRAEEIGKQMESL
ncbi:MAG: tetratricopeptide repeat protein [Cryomorphaceae bacterium]|nr:tetratricopeptide repeat protein [Cryomorphaceae bacterium]